MAVVEPGVAPSGVASRPQAVDPPAVNEVTMKYYPKNSFLVLIIVFLHYCPAFSSKVI